MRDRFYHYQEETTLRNLADENTRLKRELQRLQEETRHHKTILDFHDKLERDFFSAGSLKELIIKLINCIQIRPDIDFVSLCLTRQYLEGILGSLAYDQFLPGMDVSTGLGYLSIIEEEHLGTLLDGACKTLVEKTPRGSLAVFFPNHEDEVRSHVIIPLVLRHRMIGSLNLGSIRSRHYYTAQLGPHLLDRLSSKLAIAIDNILSHKKLALQKEILDRDINRAAILQKSLLPRPHVLQRNLEIAAYFQPCQKLGGDFYDLLNLAPNRVAIVIADVAGHGISAALIAAMLKVSLQIEDIENLSPAETLAKINRKFCHLFKHNDYITLCYSLIDLADHRGVLVRAGHPYPILYRNTSRELVELRASGPGLGLKAEASYEELEFTLSEGDTLFFYTDGLSDALRSAGHFQGFHEFILSLAEKLHAGQSWGSVQGEIRRLMEGKEREDDTSLVMVRVNPEPKKP